MNKKHCDKVKDNIMGASKRKQKSSYKGKRSRVKDSDHEECDDPIEAEEIRTNPIDCEKGESGNEEINKDIFITSDLNETEHINSCDETGENHFHHVIVKTDYDFQSKTAVSHEDQNKNKHDNNIGHLKMISVKSEPDKDTSREKEKPFSCEICKNRFSQKVELNQHLLAHKIPCDFCGKIFGVNYYSKIHLPNHSGGKQFVCERCQNRFIQEGGLKDQISVQKEKSNGSAKGFIPCPELDGNDSNFKTFSCDMCDKEFSDKISLDNHISEGHSVLACDMCDKTFTHKVHYQAHRLVHISKTRLRCGICKKGFYKKSCYDQHLLSHSGDRPYECHLCNKKFSQTSSVMRHLKTHERDKTFVCEVCQKEFRFKGNLATHMLLHAEKSFECEICQKQFRRKDVLRIHLRSHTGERPYACDKCPKAFAQKGELNVHMRMHTGEKAFGCNDCSQKFACRLSLQKHMSIAHSSEKSFVCEICQKTFSHKHTMNMHMRLHTGKAYKCEFCSKAFIRKQVLQVHRRVHTGEKPFVCDVCGKAFPEKGTLVTHFRSHTDERPFTCYVCEKVFKYRVSLRNHLKTHGALKAQASQSTVIDEMAVIID